VFRASCKIFGAFFFSMAPQPCRLALIWTSDCKARPPLSQRQAAALEKAVAQALALEGAHVVSATWMQWYFAADRVSGARATWFATPARQQRGAAARCYERQCLTTLRHDSVGMVGQRSLIMLATVNGEEAVPRAVATIPQALARASESRPHGAKNYQIDRGNHWPKHQRTRRDKYTGGVCLVPESGRASERCSPMP
jgi:hypothetical protein